MVSDPTLTVENLVGVMEKVTSDEDSERRREVWEKVLEWDYVPPFSDIDEVYLKYSTTVSEDKIGALADVYINIRPDSSWQHLVVILYAESQLAAAEEAESFFQQNGVFNPLCMREDYVSHSVCVYICVSVTMLTATYLVCKSKIWFYKVPYGVPNAYIV